MRKFAVAAALAAIGLAGTAHAVDMLYEEQLAHEEEARILAYPIAGIENHLWFDYRINVVETQKELASDLRRSTDLEDTRDAWEEYAHELKDNREDYVESMAERGYRGSVYVQG